MYDLILSHGRDDVFLYFAAAVGDFEKVLEHHVMDEAWLKAIDVLIRQVRTCAFSSSSFAIDSGTIAQSRALLPLLAGSDAARSAGDC